MFDTRKTLHNGGILDVIRILSTNNESGRLDVSVGKTEGALFFKNGRLVDARVGDLTGFRAVNAVASMRDGRFTFDPSVRPPSVSSITPNERVVLKQFFGIETIDSSTDVDEVTLETHRLPLPLPPEPVPDTQPPRSSLYRGALILAMLFILIAAGAVALRNKYRERQQAIAPSIATTEQQPTPVKADSPPATAVDQPVAAQNLSGKWNVINSVQKTRYQAFQNMNIGFELTINQSGNSFTGEGRKVSENGRSLPASSRTPIEVKGSIDGDRVEATFFESGALRKTNGRFVWWIDQASGRLNGTFASTAAGSSGKSAATREL